MTPGPAGDASCRPTGASPAVQYSHPPGVVVNRNSCPCDGCRADRARYMRGYRRNQAMRKWGVELPRDKVDVESTYKLVWSAVQDSGMSYSQVARITGVRKEVITAIHHGERKFIRRETRDRIKKGLTGVFEGTLRGKVDGSHIPCRHHLWKLQGLWAQGWTNRTLAGILRANGRGASWIHHFSNEERVEVRTIKHLDWLVDTIGDRPGPSALQRKRIQRRGIFPLIHYNEKGRLLVRSLTPDQRQFLGAVQSSHGGPSSRDQGS